MEPISALVGTFAFIIILVILGVLTILLPFAVWRIRREAIEMRRRDFAQFRALLDEIRESSNTCAATLSEINAALRAEQEAQQRGQ